MTSLRFAVALAAVFATAPFSVHAQSPAALSGTVSAGGPALEGVLVSAQKKGSSITVTVVSDKDGRYVFPASKLGAGEYQLSIRAAGFDLAGPKGATVTAGGAAVADLQLKQTGDLAAQLTNAEWLISAPGSDQQKMAMLNCVSCHTLERPFRSEHTTDEFVDTMKRMGTYANQSTPVHVQKRLAERLLEERGDAREQARRRTAEWLASVNLSSGAEWSYPLKTLPRPSGRGTRVIVTEYELPRLTIEPHDVIVDREGMVWYSNFGEQNFGRLDPRTGEVKEFDLPELKAGWPTGSLSVRFDREDNLWFGMMYQGAIGKFDRKTEQLKTYPLPADMKNAPATQNNMTSPLNIGVDGKLWLQNNGFAAVHRLDLKSGQFETIEPFGDPAKGEVHNIYDVISDSQNNAFFTDFAQRHIGRIDAKTGKVTLYPTPSANSAPRRGMMDAQDRLWFAEYRGNRIAMFDTKTEQFKEWEAPTPWSSPYDVTLDKNGEAWTGSMLTDRVLRLNPATGDFVEYLLPNSTNIRRVFVDNSTTPVTFWVGSNHGASIIKLEPLD